MRTVRNELIRIRNVLTALSILALAQVRPARAFNYVTDANGTWWGIQDAASPNVDTGSIRATQTGPGDCLFNACVTPPYSTTINGYAGVRVLVHATPAPRMNGEIMRGYGLPFNASSIVNTSSGDAIVTRDDDWVETATPLNGSTPVGGPQATVIGTATSSAATFAGAMTFAGNWLDDAFHSPLVYAGHRGNFQ